MQWSPRHEDVAFVRGWLVDISARGMRLHGPVPVLRGWRVSVLLWPQGTAPELVEGRVAWVRRAKQGCSFGLEARIDADLVDMIRARAARCVARTGPV